MSFVFQDFKIYKNLDYISCWFYKGAEYIKGHSAFLAFVSTNSITQGDQVSLLWPYIFAKNIEIGFCHQSFKWTNNAKKNAGVSCVVVGLRNSSISPKAIYTGDHMIQCEQITPYLTSGQNITVKKRNSSLCNLPKMSYGNYTGACGPLILSSTEKNDLTTKFPKSKKFIRKFIGSNEFINGIDRYCIWIRNDQLKEASLIPDIQKIICKVRKARKKSKDPCIQKLALRPHQFKRSERS